MEFSASLRHMCAVSGFSDALCAAPAVVLRMPDHFPSYIHSQCCCLPCVRVQRQRVRCTGLPFTTCEPHNVPQWTLTQSLVSRTELFVVCKLCNPPPSPNKHTQFATSKTSVTIVFDGRQAAQWNPIRMRSHG